MSTPHCSRLASPSYLNFALSIFILLGILVSYLPQHYRIISRRSSAGISPWFVLLGTTSGTCAFANILALPTSRADIACCKEVSGFECVAGVLGVAQVGVQWACFTVILILFLLFFPIPPPNKSSAPLPADLSASYRSYTPSSHSPEPTGPSYRTALLTTTLALFHLLATFITSLLLTAYFSAHLQSYANTLGILATILAGIQFLPQIYMTWRLKAVGSLSIPTMCIQTPGSFVWAGSLAGRLGKEGWSAWGLYLVTGCLQGCLLVMGVWFEFFKGGWGKDPKIEEEQRQGNGEAHGHTGDYDEERRQANGIVDDERTGLLANER